MLSPDELTLLYALARDHADGRGAIVDAGCFLGGSSVALLAGLRDRDREWTGPPLSTYDLFRVEEYTREQFFKGSALKVGDSFRPLYDQHVAPFTSPHVVHEGDITQIGWDGGPIDVFFVDVLKSWEVNAAVQRSFFPHLIPGRSLIVHQDYGWGMLPWIHLSVELMWDSLRRLDVLPWATHVFLLERPVDPDVLALDPLRDLSAADRLALLDRAIEHNEGEARGMVALSKASLLGYSGQRGAALELIEAVEADHPGNASIKACADGTRVMLQASGG
ncbi:hypothetical protein [Conexibacter sp. CPCC 206217]|uniref:hypothetical protein n=1 Tax=Conexibacter sp. CPCC 206217 TaxID=3064574 RepID=UPI00272D6094|nr:hypothetical protein [Conexibacter sp. CPCC 206217]